MQPASKMRKGNTILYNGEPYKVILATHQKTGRGSANIQSKLRRLSDGSHVEYRWRSDEKFDDIKLEETPMEYLYQDGDEYCFMNSENYEQIMLHKDVLGDAVNYLIENTPVGIAFYESNPMDIVLPKTVVLKITETGPNVKGNSSGAVTKPATLETGLVVQVPVFVLSDEKIIVNTEDGSYSSRSKD